jgi:hypothetical protein
MPGRRTRHSSPCPRPLSAGRTSVQWSGGRLVSTRPVSTRPARSGCPDGHASGVRGRGVRAVRTALDPGMRRCGGVAHVWAHRVRRVAVVGERLGRRCPNRAWRGGDGCALAVRGSHEGRRETWAAAAHAHRLGAPRSPPGRPRELVQRQGAGRWRWEYEKEQVLTSPPQVRPEQVAGVMADHRLAGSGDHAPWSLCCVGPGRSAPEGPIRFGGEQAAAAARPRQVRSAVRQELTAR